MKYFTLILVLLLLPTITHAQGARFLSVIDGDTIKVLYQGKVKKVRLIGVDTPETKHPRKPVEYYGKEASAFTTSMVEGKTVRLEFDHTLRDRYGRLLAYVYLGDVMINEELIRQGYSEVYDKYPFKYLERFKKDRGEERGLSTKT